MQDPYKELKRLVDKGDLSITYIDAPPRTVSSPFFRSLAQVIPAQKYEPFHFTPRNFERGLEILLDKAKEAGVYDSATTKPVKLVTKEIARYLPPEDWERWMPLVDNFIAIMRDPHLQMHSLVRRAANDLHYKKKGASGLSEEEVWKLAEQVGNVFKNGGSIAGQSIPGDYDRTCWGYLSEHLVKLDAHLKSHPKKQLMVVDGFLLRAVPNEVMSEVLLRLGITPSSTVLEKVVSKWDPATSDYLREQDDPPDFAYTKKAIDTTGFKPPLDETPPLSKFPSVLRQHIANTAMPIYLDFLQWPHRIGPKTPQELLHVLNQELGGTSLIERNPVTAYALMASLDRESLNAEAQHDQNEQLKKLRERFPDHSDAYNLIDHVISGHQKPNTTLTVTSAEMASPIHGHMTTLNNDDSPRMGT